MLTQTNHTFSLISYVRKAIITHAKESLFFAAAFCFLASIVSMAIIYGDPLAHIKICLGSTSAPLIGADTLVLYGHCGWCYLALGLALAAILAPGKSKT